MLYFIGYSIPFRHIEDPGCSSKSDLPSCTLHSNLSKTPGLIVVIGVYLGEALLEKYSMCMHVCVSVCNVYGSTYVCVYALHTCVYVSVCIMYVHV